MITFASDMGYLSISSSIVEQLRLQSRFGLGQRRCTFICICTIAEEVAVVGVEVAPPVEEDIMVLVAESPARKDGPDSLVDSSIWCGDQLSPLAKKIPKATRTTGHQETKRRELQRAASSKSSTGPSNTKACAPKYGR